MAVFMDHDHPWPPAVSDEYNIVMCVSEKTASLVERFDGIQHYCVVKRWHTVGEGWANCGPVLVSAGWRGKDALSYIPPSTLLRQLVHALEKDAEDAADWGASSEASDKVAAAQEIEDLLDTLEIKRKAWHRVAAELLDLEEGR